MGAGRKGDERARERASSSTVQTRAQIGWDNIMQPVDSLLALNFFMHPVCMSQSSFWLMSTEV